MRPLILALLLLLLAGCGADPTRVTITRAEYGDAWPFTVSEVVLRCFRTGEVIVEANDLPYALNGTARARYDPIDPIWRNDPANPGAKIPVGDLIARGNAMCK